MNKILKLIFTLFLVNFSFAQCNEYYINELVSGQDDKCYFPNGSPIRFCPNLNGIAINGLTLDAIQWTGVGTQQITLTKNGGNAGYLTLKLKEKEVTMNLYGCSGERTYSISMNKTELDDFYKSKDAKIIEEINSLVNSEQYEKAFDLTSKLLQKNNYDKLSDLEKLSNEQRLSNYRILISKSKEEMKSENYLGAAKFFSEIKLPTNLDWNEQKNYSSIRSSIEEKLKTLYNDSVIILKTNFQFSNDNSSFNINGKEIALNQEIFNHIDSLGEGNYFLRITQIPNPLVKYYGPDKSYQPTLNFDIVGKKFGINLNFENGSLWLTCVPGWPASKLGLPSKIKIKSIDGISFTNSAEPLSYIAEKEAIIISYWDTLSNIIKEQKINRGFVKLVSLPGNQKSCTRWMQGGGCVDYYTANLIEGWSTDSLKTIDLGVFNLSAANLIPFKLETKIENPTIAYYTKRGETLKIFNEKFYRNVKGQKSLKLETIFNQNVEDNILIKSEIGNCNYFINGTINYSIKNKRINSAFPIIELLPKSN